MKEKIWITKDGQELKIQDMETLHIERCIKMLEKNADFYDEYYGSCFADNADYCYEENSHLVRFKINEFKKELEKRNEGCDNAVE